MAATQGEQGAEKGQGHVLLRIPGIALGADEGLPGVFREQVGAQPLHQFVAGRGSQHEFQGHIGAPPATQAAQALDHLANGARQQQAVGEMHQPVVVIALQAQRLVQAKACQASS